MSNLKLELVESEAKIVLEALMDMEDKMSQICDTSGDEDEIAEIGNDLIELRLLINPLKDKAKSLYGDGVLNFSKDLL